MVGYFQLHDSENDGPYLYKSFEITYDSLPCAKVLGEALAVLLSKIEIPHVDNSILSLNDGSIHNEKLEQSTIFHYFFDSEVSTSNF